MPEQWNRLPVYAYGRRTQLRNGNVYRRRVFLKTDKYLYVFVRIRVDAIQFSAEHCKMSSQGLSTKNIRSQYQNFDIVERICYLQMLSRIVRFVLKAPYSQDV